MDKILTIEKGNQPKLLIHCGTHGDEYEVIDLVTEAVRRCEPKLPDFIYVPQVSPSAVKNKTRKNANGFDLNRIFSADSPDQEVQANIKIMENHHFDLFLSFHEDPERDEYYIYDASFNDQPTQSVLYHNHWLKKNKFKLLTGFDDPKDPDLGYEFINGYRKFKHRPGQPDNGMVATWAMNRKIIDQELMPEIPGKISLESKKIIVDSFFDQVLLNYF